MPSILQSALQQSSGTRRALKCQEASSLHSYRNVCIMMLHMYTAMRYDAVVIRSVHVDVACVRYLRKRMILQNGLHVCFNTADAVA